MKILILLSMIALTASVSFSADQKVLDFCHEYIGDALKEKKSSGGFKAMPAPIFQNISSFTQPQFYPKGRDNMQFYWLNNALPAGSAENN